MPEVSAVHINTPLTNLAIGYQNDGFISQRLLAEVAVRKATDSYFIFDSTRQNIMEVDDKRRPGAKANEVDFDMTNSTYTTLGHALQSIVPDEEEENADSPITPQIDKTEALVERLMTGQDINCKSQLDASLTGAQTSDPTHEWDDYTNGDPLADIRLAINTIEDVTGFRPNVVAMDRKVFRAVKDHPDVLERVIYGGSNPDPAKVSEEAIATVFDVEEIVVAGALKNTAIQGQTASLSRVWGSDVYVLYRPTRAAIKVPACGYRFVWEQFMGSQNTSGWLVETWRDDERKGNMVRVQKHYDQKITLATAGYRLQNRLS